MADTLLLRNSVFGPMHNLTFLKFFQHLGGIVSNLQLISDDYVLSRNLKLLHWDAYPLTILPPIFRPHTIIELSLRYSKLNSLWDGTKVCSFKLHIRFTLSDKVVILLPIFPVILCFAVLFSAASKPTDTRCNRIEESQRTSRTFDRSKS